MLKPLERDLGRAYEVFSPVDGRSLGTYDVADAAQVEAAVERARVAQQAWAKTSLEHRAKLMQRALAVVLERQDELIERLTAETGRPTLDTLMIELFATCDAMNYYGRRCKKVLADRKPGLHLLRAKKAKLVYRPYGVVAVISPWNGPLILSINPTVQAVLAGNAVIVKPSEVTPEAGRITAEVFEQAGFPEHLVQTVLGDGETGAALLDSGIDKVTFTGSVATGRKIGEACGRNLVPFTLELGGKDAMIVCADADVTRAAHGAVFGGVMNTGQFCSGIERVYVHRAVADEFTQQVAERMGALVKDRDYGPFIMARQCDIVDRQVSAAVEAGATVLCGGERDGHYYPPTVLVDVDHGMALMKEETFGPVLPIIVVDDDAEAIRLANDCAYGLSASVWTTDKAKGERIARQLEAGSATINETSMVYGALELPFGGAKASGVGSVNGASGLLSYCRPFPILTDRFGLKEEAVWHPYTEDKTEKLMKALRVMWGSPLKWLL